MRAGKDRFDISGTLPAFDRLKSAFASAKPSLAGSAAYTPTANPPPCQTKNEMGVSTVLPPPVYPKLCSCMTDSLRCLENKDDPLAATHGYRSRLDIACENDWTANCVGIIADEHKGRWGAYRYVLPIESQQNFDGLI